MARPKSEMPWLDRRENGKYYAHWYDAGERRTKRLSMGTEDADTAKARFAAFLVEGGDLVRGAPGLRLSVRSAVERYLVEHADVRCADPDRQHDIAAHLYAFFGETPMASVNIPLSRKYAAARGAAPATIVRELGMLVAAANHAVRWERMPADQMPTVEYPHVPEREAQFFTTEEVAAIFREAEGRLKAFVVLAYFTAARRRAIERLEVGQVDLQAKVLRLHKSGERKTAKRKATVPINDACKRELQMLLMLTESKWVFGTPTCFYRQFRRLCGRLGFGDRDHPHLLRHSRATHLLQDGKDIYLVAKLLGDTVATVQRRYGHHTPEYLASAVAADDAALALL